MDTSNTAPTPADVAARLASKEESKPEPEVKPQEQKDTDSSSQLSHEDALKALAEVRRDAAKYRTERNALKEAAESTKSDAEKVQDRLKALEDENRRIKLDSARATAAKEVNVSPDLLQGDSDEEITAQAKVIAELVEQRVQEALDKAVPFAPKVPREKAGGQPIADGDWLGQVMRGK